MPTTQEVLDKARNLLLSFNKNNTEVSDWVENYNAIVDTMPIQRHRCFSPLVPSDFQWRDKIWNIYQPTSTEYFEDWPDDFTIIFHGHSRPVNCHFEFGCHVKGYKPVGTEHRRFQRLWNKEFPWLM